ncbi:MAG: 3-oxoacyl-[acyl-carrier-protein] reductase [Lachnospiraceae bacterium]|nr:3-oxoacyl-[acyl-carrier-protein] reductase [Lachnospiraceae bacterium]
MLTGKIAIVTGASRGIGRQIAKTLAEQGASVIVNYCGSQQSANETVEQITAFGGTAKAYQADVSDYTQAADMMNDVVKEYGRIDILINNAGITRDNLILKMNDEDFMKVINTNLTGTFNCVKHASKIMLKQKYGRIVNMASIVGIYGNAGQANYAASKAGVIGMTKSVAKELGSRNITVNAIAPGYIGTDMTDSLPDAAKEKITSAIAMKRMGTVEDVANLAAFLASDKASYITGQVIGVDGGMSI